MKQFLGAGLLLVVAAGSAAAQDSKLYSDPALPSPDVLKNLNMRMAWRVNVPMDGRRDGFNSIQVHGGQVIAATRGGVVAAYDSESGRELWKIVVGKPDDATYKPTFNSKSVLVVRGVHLYAIDRVTGGLQWKYRMPFGIASAPVADERQIYLSGINAQVAAFDLPAQGALGTPSIAPVLRTEDPIEERYQKERDNLVLREVHPEIMWRAQTSLKLDNTAVMTRDSLFYATPDGYLALFGKYPLDSKPVEAYRFQLDNRLTAAPGIYDEMAYIPTSDQNLYAVSITAGKTRWRYAAGNPVIHRPFATDIDVFVTVERKGLVRLDRDTGKSLWTLPFGRTTTDGVAEADRVLAVNNKWVYATDTGGRLRVLDRATGKQLSYYEPFRDYNFHVHNEATDRLLLAANNGLIVCLHDREYEKPLIHRKFENETGAPEGRVKKLKERLARKITDRGADALPVIDVLESYRRKYSLDIFLSDKAFLDAGVPSIKDKPLLQPAVNNQEVGQVLKEMLATVNATYEIVGDTIHVLPAKKGLPTDVEPPPMPNIDPKIRELLAKRMDAPAIEKLTIGEFMEQYFARFAIKLEIDKKAFMAVGIDPEEILKKEVVHPKDPKGKGLPFSQVLRETYSQVKGEYEVRDDTIYLIPAKK